MNVIERLIVLQGHDTVIRDVEQQRKDIPSRKQGELARLKADEAGWAAAKERVAEITKAIHATELEIQMAREQIAKYKTQQLSLKTNQEFAAMAREIRKVEETIRHHETAVAGFIEQMEPAERKVEEQRAKYETAKGQVDGYLSEMDERLAAAEATLATAMAERAAFYASLDAPEMRRHLMMYERLTKNRWPVIVEIKDGICTGCHMALPPSKAQAVRKGQEVVTCDFCGRLVY
ncbi:MAG: C4-type zinc ribbon domain-containing protein [Kiritimatiellaeota bacterium]|nr:C4-type zinc ribbon domain-containing protein [Kiritimatiellota bacterium]